MMAKCGLKGYAQFMSSCDYRDLGGVICTSYFSTCKEIVYIASWVLENQIIRLDTT